MKRFAPLVLIALTGCVAHSQAIRSGSASFNETLQYNQSQQMLLNLVRLKYRETPFFLKIGALSASYDFEINAEASLLDTSGGGNTVNGLRVGGGYSSRPTVTYTPLEGNTYVKQILSEVDPDTFVLLVRSGWPVTALCNVMVERIGDAMNNQSDPSYEKFLTFVRNLQEAQDARGLRFTVQDGALALVVETEHPDLFAPERAAARETSLPFSTLQLRSLLDIMFFLSKNTEVPPDRADQVKASKPNGWMTIHASTGRPERALVWAEHDGYYYSIDRTDIQSKDTFALLKLLFQVQAGDIKTIGPILTLPVGAN